MNRELFAHVGPLCPVCLAAGRQSVLEVTRVLPSSDPDWGLGPGLRRGDDRGGEMPSSRVGALNGSANASDSRPFSLKQDDSTVTPAEAGAQSPSGSPDLKSPIPDGNAQTPRSSPPRRRGPSPQSDSPPRSGEIAEGILGCPDSNCRREYPIVDGIPLLFADLVGVMANQGGLLLERQDLSPEMETLLGDAFGPGSSFDTARQHLSTYGEAHWGDLATPADGAGRDSAATFAALIDRAFETAPPPENGLLLDLGCALGRGTAALAARAAGPILGVDLHLGLLRRAAAAHSGSFHYPRRETGLVYQRALVQATPLAAYRDRCDFWAADATRLPLAGSCAAGVLALNLLDCVVAPWDLLRELARVLEPGGILWLATPWDWSTSATPFAAWLGGHSQRGGRGGDSSAILRDLAAGGFDLIGEAPRLPWKLRLHARSSIEYAVDLLVLRRRGGDEV